MSIVYFFIFIKIWVKTFAGNDKLLVGTPWICCQVSKCVLISVVVVGTDREACFCCSGQRRNETVTLICGLSVNHPTVAMDSHIVPNSCSALYTLNLKQNYYMFMKLGRSCRLVFL